MIFYLKELNHKLLPAVEKKLTSDETHASFLRKIASPSHYTHKIDCSPELNNMFKILKLHAGWIKVDGGAEFTRNSVVNRLIFCCVVIFTEFLKYLELFPGG